MKTLTCLIIPFQASSWPLSSLRHSPATPFVFKNGHVFLSIGMELQQREKATQITDVKLDEGLK